MAIDIQSAAQQVVETLQGAPGRINEALSDPRGFIGEVTGQDASDLDLAAFSSVLHEKAQEAGLGLSSFDLTSIDLGHISGEASELIDSFAGGGIGGLLGKAGGLLGNLFGR